MTISINISHSYASRYDVFLSLSLSRLSNGSPHPRNGLIDFLIGAPRPVITTVEPLILSPRTWRKQARADVHASSIIRKLEITVHARPRCLTSFTLVRDERRSTTSLLSRLVTTMLVSDSERWARLDTDAPKQVDENRDIKDQKKSRAYRTDDYATRMTRPIGSVWLKSSESPKRSFDPS